MRWRMSMGIEIIPKHVKASANFFCVHYLQLNTQPPVVVGTTSPPSVNNPATGSPMSTTHAASSAATPPMRSLTKSITSSASPAPTSGASHSVFISGDQDGDEKEIVDNTTIDS